jgi:hypothetical protein
MHSHSEISKKNHAAKSRKSHNGPKTIMKIPLENLKRTTCSTKHAVAKGLSKIRRKQSSFTVKARKEGERTLSKMPWPAKKANSNFMHNQLLSPLLNIFITPPPPTYPPFHPKQNIMKSLMAQNKLEYHP